MRRVRSRTGAEMAVIGQGTWRMGEDPRRRAEEIAALRLGLDLGMTLVDTAEMYAEGGAEQVVGEAIRGRRHEVFLVSKVLPHHASYEGTRRAAEGSLRRLGTDYLDLYLLHWPGPHPLEETLRTLQRLREEGKIRHYGLSNFDRAAMEEAEGLAGGDEIAADQVLYNLERRAIERSLLPWCQPRGVVIMAYSPLEQGQLRQRPGLVEVARRCGVSPSQVALAWTVRHPGVVAIPKASRPEHVRANAAAAQLELAEEDLARLDADYPPPEPGARLEWL